MIAIIGAGGHGKCAYDCFFQQGLKVAGFFDDDRSKKGVVVIDGHVVIGEPMEIDSLSEIDSVFVAIGDNRLRLEYYFYYKQKGYNMPDAIHSKAFVSDFASVDSGSFLMGAAVVNPGSRVGESVIINTSATVGHDCQLENGVQIGPGVNIAGGCLVGEGAFIGIGAKIGPGVNIGAWSVVGAGSVVLADVPEGAFCCGIPARVVRA
jgi:UDP-perosamine 4-acetyltransferase